MENAVISKIKNQAKNLKTLSEELQVQMALGKAEAIDLIEKERKTLSKYINQQRKQIADTENVSNENRRKFLGCVEDLETALYSEVPAVATKYDKYKDNILHRVYKLEEEVRNNYPSMTEEMQEMLDTFKTKMDAFRVNLALHDKDNPEKVEKIRNEFTQKLGEIREVLDNKENAQSKLDNFMEDISESFNYLKRAIADLSN